MSNLAVSATTTPYSGVSSTSGSSSSTTVSSTSSATTKTVTSSTTPSSSTTANQTVTVATSSNTATLSSSTTYAYGNSASNSTSKMVSSTTVYATSSSTTPSVTSGTLERNGGYITILSSSSTTPSVTSSSTTPQVNSSSTAQTITPEIEEAIENYYPDGYMTSIQCQVLGIEKPEVDIMDKLNSLEEYSYNDTEDLFGAIRDKYSRHITNFFDTAGDIGIEFSVNTEIPIAEFSVANASAKLYIEIGANNASDISLLTIENSISEFSEEILDVDNFVDLFASVGANGKNVGLNSENEEILSYEKDGFEISINKSKLQQGVFQMTVEKSVEVENGSFTVGLELEFRPNDDFYGQVEEISANVKNDSYKDYAKDNCTEFDPIEHLFISNGFFEEKGFFGRYVDIWAGTPSISREMQQSISESVEEKMEKIIEEELSNE